MVLGVIIANALVIQGAKDASSHIDAITIAVSTQAGNAIELIEKVEGEVTTVRAELLQYNDSAYTELTRLKNVLVDTRQKVTTIVTEGKNWSAPHRAYTYQVFLDCSYEIDSTMDKARIYAERAKQFTNALNLENNTDVKFVSEVMRMLDNMLVEIEKSEEMVTTLGNIGVQAVDKYTNSSNTVSLDLSVIFVFARKIKQMLTTVQSFIGKGKLFSIQAALPDSEDSAVAMVMYVAETGDNVTKLLDSQFNRVFDTAIGTIDVMTSKLDLYTQTLFKKNCDDLLMTLAKMREMMEYIRDQADLSSVRLRAAFMAPGIAVGAFGIVVAVLVEIFAVVARMKRYKGIAKANQITLQNVLYFVVFVTVDVYIIVSFLLALLFMFIAALQFSLVMLCKVDISLCNIVKLNLTPAVQLMVVGVIMNTFMSYHLIGAIQGTWARFIGGLRHCCGNALAHDTSNFDTTGTGFTNHVSKDGPVRRDLEQDRKDNSVHKQLL
jgi:hypothetical protein